MKFTDGNWMLQPGVQAHYATEAYEAAVAPTEVEITVPTRPIRHRGDTLQGPLLTVRLSSPLADVVRVSVVHHSGARPRGPALHLEPLPPPEVSIDQSTSEVSLRSGALTARVARQGGWELTFFAGEKVLTRSGGRALGYVQYAGRGTFLHEQLSLGVGEYVYGLGERFTAFVKNGQVVETVNKDGGTGSEQAYKAVPFYLTNHGYGVLVHDSGPVSFEVASEKVSRVQFSVPGETLDYFLIYGPTPRDILRKLTALTGRPALPPAWSFGLWLSTSFTTSYDEATVTGFIDGMAKRDLPLHVFHFDCFWMRGFEWCNFRWDPATFPDPAGMLKRLHDRGLKICVWINPYIAQRSPLFEEGRKGGFLLLRPNGDIWQTDQWQPGLAIVDFTNPSACEWFRSHLRRLVEMGVDCFKTDFGERIPLDVTWHDGSDPERMHNHYSVLYNEVVFDLLEEARGKGQAVVFARSATTSGQRFPAHWGGDCSSSFESMAESLRGGLSLGLCGFGFWSHDIGGFEGLPPAALYKRWVAFGLLSSHSRLHGSTSARVPWNYDESACDVLRFFTKLKGRLMPYLYGAAVEAHEQGLPVMRAMMLEFPDDPACVSLDRQYMLGGGLLVAPVFREDGWAEFYLPEGRWTNLLTAEEVAGGRWMRTRHDFFSLPLWVRAGTLLPWGAQERKADYDFTDGVTFRLYALPDGGVATCTVPDAKGAPAVTLVARRSGDTYTAEFDGERGVSWRLQLVGVARVLETSGASTLTDPFGTSVAAGPGARSLRIRAGSG